MVVVVGGWGWLGVVGTLWSGEGIGEREGEQGGEERREEEVYRFIIFRSPVRDDHDGQLGVCCDGVLALGDEPLRVGRS